MVVRSRKRLSAAYRPLGHNPDCWAVNAACRCDTAKTSPISARSPPFGAAGESSVMISSGEQIRSFWRAVNTM
jgi:hypothetical protein